MALCKYNYFGYNAAGFKSRNVVVKLAVLLL